jgi:hypothetical protein
MRAGSPDVDNRSRGERGKNTVCYLSKRRGCAWSACRISFFFAEIVHLRAHRRRIDVKSQLNVQFSKRFGVFVCTYDHARREVARRSLPA